MTNSIELGFGSIAPQTPEGLQLPTETLDSALDSTIGRRYSPDAITKGIGEGFRLYLTARSGIFQTAFNVDFGAFFQVIAPQESLEWIAHPHHG